MSPQGIDAGFRSPRKCRCERSACEQQQKRDEQREDAERFGHGEAENQVRALALRSRRIAQRAVQELAEDHADADAGAALADGGETCADVLCCDWIHGETPSWMLMLS